MKLSYSQSQIIHSHESLIAIHAVAGSGKSTTLAHFTLHRPQERFLYLVFNRTAKLDAEAKFASLGIRNVQIQTAHGLAWSFTSYNHRKNIQQKPFNPKQFCDYFGLEQNPFGFSLAVNALKVAQYFCSSAFNKVQDIEDFSTLFSDNVSAVFFKNSRDKIIQLCREYLAAQHSGKLPISHDFYLKLFQLSRPQLNFDWILLDEAQDCSPAILDIFFSQNCKKALVGDPHQQIYGWRNAVNAFDFCDGFTHSSLSESFRFTPSIANIAMDVLSWKEPYTQLAAPEIIGLNALTKPSSHFAILGRTHLGLLKEAFNIIHTHPRSSLWFEGQLSSYTYANDGTHLWDIYNLKTKQLSKINDPLLQQFSSIDEFEEYLEQTGDTELKLLLDIVDEFNDDLPRLFSKLKTVQSTDKSDAQFIFSTVHKSKGLEYNKVRISADFMNPAQLKTSMAKLDENGASPRNLLEEMNLLYVAITRAQCQLELPETLCEFLDFNDFKEHIVLKKANSKDRFSTNTLSQDKSWNADLDKELIRLYYRDHTILQIAKHFKRPPNAIRVRLKYLDFDI